MLQERMITAEKLGSRQFRAAHGVRYAYASGSMVKGIASEELVLRMARANLLSYFGTGGLALDRVESAILRIQEMVGRDAPFGMNLLCNTTFPEKEDQTIDLFLRHDVRRVEASAFTQVTPGLVRYRLRGLALAPDGSVRVRNMIQAKVSRPEVSQQFFGPAPEKLVTRLLESGHVTAEEARLSQHVPMADDVCVESDSGGHTDKGVALCLLPTILRQRDEIARARGLPSVRVGAAGGLGTPEAVAAVFVLGADFVLTGSINQCTVEASTSDAVKDILEQANVQDTEMAPAGDMFEYGARVQVLRKGLFFPARANKLYELYRQYESLEQIDVKTREQLEEKFFKAKLDRVVAEVADYLKSRSPQEFERFTRSPKIKMARVFQAYFFRTNRAAIEGEIDEKLNFQIHCGPAMGACNRWLRGTELESWRRRHVDDLARLLMQGAAALLNERFAALSSADAGSTDAARSIAAAAVS